MKTLSERLSDWGQTQGRAGWAFSLDVCLTEGPNWGKVEASMGPVTAYGYTSNQAINYLADGMCEEGWPDDREYCDRCEGDGELRDLAPCTTHDRDCACNGPRVDLGPCPDCEGIGLVAAVAFRDSLAKEGTDA